MDSVSIADKIQKRARELQKITDRFLREWNSVEHNVKIVCKENAAIAISSLYFSIVEKVKAGYMKEESYVNRFKVAAATEIAARMFMPISIEDKSLKKTEANNIKLNSHFATFLALQLLSGIVFARSGNHLPNSNDENIKNALVNHYYWVMFYVPDENAYPVFLSSTFWEMYTAALLKS